MEPQLLQRRNSAGWGAFLLVFTISIGMGAHTVRASTTVGTIDTTYKYAWSNVGGWVNFGATNGGITVTDTTLTGYAWSTNDGWINFAPSQSGVTNDGAGNLSGFAWDAGAGWVNFSGVTINSSGKFTGTATGGTVNGASYVINFDCTNCDVRTDWRPSSSRTTTAAAPGSISFIFAPSSPSSQTSSSQPGTGQPPPSASLAENTPGNPSRGTASAGGAGQGAFPSLPLKSASASTSSKTPARTATSTAGGAKFFSKKSVQAAAVPVSIVAVALFLIFLIRFFL